MKTKTFEAMADCITPCCGYELQDVVLETIHWDYDYEIAICTCGRVLKIEHAIGLITVMERE